LITGQGIEKYSYRLLVNNKEMGCSYSLIDNISYRLIFII
jgi:hypothetical protein